MLAIIDDIDKSKIKILDTNDGVVECISESELLSLQGIRLYRKPQYRRVADFYIDLVKADTLGKICEPDFIKYVYQNLLQISTFVKSIKVLENLYEYMFFIKRFRNHYILIYTNCGTDFVYSIGNDGVFYYDVKKPYSYEIDVYDSGINIYIYDRTKMIFKAVEVDEHLKEVRLIHDFAETGSKI